MLDRNFISEFILYLRGRSAFVGTLSLFAEYQQDLSIPLVSTQGIKIFCNPNSLNPLSSKEKYSHLLHCLLHSIFHFDLFYEETEKKYWNKAADIAIGNILFYFGLPSCM